MVAMGVGDEDRRELFAGDCLEQRVDMAGDRRPGVDDRDLAFADDIGTSAGEGEGARIGRDQPARQWRDAREFARRRGEGEIEDGGEAVGGHFGSRSVRRVYSALRA